MAVTQPTPGLNLLVVDDEAQILELLDVTLNLKGYQVETALSGPEALQRLETQVFDVIIMDVLMTPWDGFETLRRMYQRWGAALPPVVFLSGLNRPDQMPFLHESVLEDYLVKPFRPSQLVEAIERLWIEAQRKSL